MQGRLGTRAIPGLIALGAVAALCISRADERTVLAQSSQTPQSTADQPSRVADLASALHAPESPALSWKNAAAGLLKYIDDPAAKAALQSALWDDHPPGVRRAVADAIAASPEGTSSLVRSLGTALVAARNETDGTGDAAAIIAALSRFRTKEAVRALMDGIVLDDRADDETLKRACDALARMMSRGDAACDRSSWAAWWSRAQWYEAEAWNQEVAGKSPDPVEPRIMAESDGERLATVYRRLHALTPESGREPLLIEMLEAPEEAVRLAAFDLITLSLVNARPVGDGAAAAAAARLADRSPRVRAEAARSVGLLGRAEATDLLLAALAKESDRHAVAAMLRAAGRRPDVRLIEPALRWIDAPDGDAWTAACEALDAAKRADLLNDERDRNRLMAALVARPVASWPKPAFRLAVALGEQGVVQQVLMGRDRVLAGLAGEALAESRTGIEVLLAAASTNADLFSSAASAVLLHAPTAAGYARLSALPAPTEADRDAALRAVAAVLPPEELLVLSRSQPDHALRESLLGPLVTQEFLAETDDLPERVEVALVLARTRLVLNRPSDSLATLQLLPTDWQGPRALALRVTALLCLGRIEDAEAVAPQPTPTQQSPPLLTAAAAEAWLEAMEICTDQQKLPSVLAAFARRFDGELSPEHAARLQAVRLRITE